MSMAGEINGDSDYIWQPPSEAEMKVIRARRERDNQISQRMGDYLLKGYKMLGSMCTCGTILLQDRNGSNYCIACKELDSDVDKDDPVRNQEAALGQVREQELFAHKPQSCETEDRGAVAAASNVPQPGYPTASSVNTGLMTSSACQTRVTSSGDDIGIHGQTVAILHPTLADTAQILTQKLTWSADELHKTSSVEYSIQLCQLIKHCADALLSIKSAG